MKRSLSSMPPVLDVYLDADDHMISHVTRYQDMKKGALAQWSECRLPIAAQMDRTRGAPSSPKEAEIYSRVAVLCDSAGRTANGLEGRCTIFCT